MRTTVTSDPDTEALVKQTMRARGMTFKEVVNTAIRTGLATGGRTARFSTPTFAMGAHPGVNLDQALRLASELEDEEFARLYGVQNRRPRL